MPRFRKSSRSEVPRTGLLMLLRLLCYSCCIDISNSIHETRQFRATGAVDDKIACVIIKTTVPRPNSLSPKAINPKPQFTPMSSSDSSKSSSELPRTWHRSSDRSVLLAVLACQFLQKETKNTWHHENTACHSGLRV